MERLICDYSGEHDGRQSNARINPTKKESGAVVAQEDAVIFEAIAKCYRENLGPGTIVIV